MFLDQNSEGHLASPPPPSPGLHRPPSPLPLRIFHSSRIKQSREPKTHRLWSFRRAERTAGALSATCVQGAISVIIIFSLSLFMLSILENRVQKKEIQEHLEKATFLTKAGWTNDLSSQLFCHTRIGISLLPTASSQQPCKDSVMCWEVRVGFLFFWQTLNPNLNTLIQQLVLLWNNFY